MFCFYYLDLIVEQVKSILMQLVVKDCMKVKKLGFKEDMVFFFIFSVIGGIVNVYEVVKLAEQIKGKKKGVSCNNSGVLNVKKDKEDSNFVCL